MLIVVDDELTVIGVLGWMVVQQMFTCSHETANRSMACKSVLRFRFRIPHGDLLFGTGLRSGLETRRV